MRLLMVLPILIFSLGFAACEKKTQSNLTYEMPMTAIEALESISEKLQASSYNLDYMDIQSYEIQTLPQEISIDELYRLADVKVSRNRISGAQCSYYFSVQEDREGKARVKVEAIVEGEYQKARRSTDGHKDWEPFPSKGVAERELWQAL